MGFAQLGLSGAKMKAAKKPNSQKVTGLQYLRCDMGMTCSNQEDKLQHHLTSQGLFFSNVIKYSLSSVNSRTFTILPSATSITPSPHVIITVSTHEEPQAVIFLHGIWRHIKEFGIEGQIPRISSPVKLGKRC